MAQDGLEFVKSYVEDHIEELNGGSPSDRKTEVIDGLTKGLEKIEVLQDSHKKLALLEAYGVDNWPGYGMAMSDEEGIMDA